MPKQKSATQRSKTTSNHSAEAVVITTSRKRQPKRKATVIPVPDPPLSLIKLLRNDKGVLNYFTALQQNLDQDVQKWKDKALEYKSELNQLHKQQNRHRFLDKRGDEQLPLRMINVPKHGVNDESSLDIDDASSEEQMESIRIRNELNTVSKYEDLHHEESLIAEGLVSGSEPKMKLSRFEEGKKASQNKMEYKIKRKEKNEETTITDEIIDQLFVTSSSSSNSSHGSFIHRKKETKEEETQKTNDGNDESQKREMRKEVITFLIEAYENLQKLGVRVVDIQVPKHNQPDAMNLQTNNEALCKKLSQEALKGETTLKFEASIQEESVLNDLSSSGNDHGDLYSNVCLNKSEEKNDSCATPKEGDDTYFFLRRPDDLVVTDLIRAVRSIIRLPTSEMVHSNSKDIGASQRFQPFVGNNLVPCFYAYKVQPKSIDNKNIVLNGDTLRKIESDDQSLSDDVPHPAVSGFRLVCRSLMILDTYTSPNSPFLVEEEWEKILKSL